MQVTCLQDNLKRGLALVGRVVASKSTLPVLSNVLLSTSSGRLMLAATNLEIAATCWIGAKVAREGAITVPAMLLVGVVSNLPNDVVDLELDDQAQTLQLRCGYTATSFAGIAADEFPTIPTVVDQALAVALPTAAFREAIDQVVFAAATDDTRPILAGVLLKFADTNVTLIATNGFRLSMGTISLSEPVASPLEVIVPARTLMELARSLNDSDDLVHVTITPSAGQIVLRTGQVEFVSRLIDGRFPDVMRVIPARATTCAVLDTQALAQAVKLASYFASASANITKLVVDPRSEERPGHLTLRANAAAIGENHSVLDGLVHGESAQIALNVKYLAEAVGAIRSPQIVIELQPGNTPAVVKPVGNDEFVHVIMPMTIH